MRSWGLLHCPVLRWGVQEATSQLSAAFWGTERATGLCCMVTHNRSHGNSTNLCQGRFGLDVRKHFFSMRVGEHWNRLPLEVVDAPCLSVFRRHLDNALNNSLYLLISSGVVRQLDSTIFVGPLQLHYSILIFTIT